MEVWKDIIGVEGCYQISNLGRVKSLERYTENGRHVLERILKTRVNKQGYEYVSIQKNNKRVSIKIHRTVAQAFILNPSNFLEVNHKDENKLNNCVDNLEWCDRRYNANYGTAMARAAKTRADNHILEINQYTLDGKFIKRWRSPIDIERASNKKMRATNIIACCRGKYKTSYGYIWKYN
jgi:hypothetical protein